MTTKKKAPASAKRADLAFDVAKPSSAKAPAGYDASDYPPFAVTVDILVLTLIDGRLHVLLIRRADEPHAGSWALPGGFVREDESLERAARRELDEETGVDAASHLEQFGAYGDPTRDPRMRVVSIAFLAVLRDVGQLSAGGEADEVQLVPVSDVLHTRRYPLAFDHRRMLEDGVEVVRNKLEFTSLATAFVGPEFTLTELRTVYESAWDTDLDPGNFRRKVLSTDGFVEPTGRTKPPGPEGGKPGEVYRSGQADFLIAPLRRPRKPK